MLHHIDFSVFINWQCLSVFASQNYLMIYESNLRPGLTKLINLLRFWLAYCDFFTLSPCFLFSRQRVTSFSTSYWTLPNPLHYILFGPAGEFDESTVACRAGWLLKFSFIGNGSVEESLPSCKFTFGSFPSVANLIHCKPTCIVIVRSSAFVFGCTVFYLFWGGGGQCGDLFKWEVQVHGTRLAPVLVVF